MPHKPDIRAGFSLVEVMVVMVIVGLMSAMVLLVARAPQRQIDRAADNLQAHLNHATELALTSGDMTAMGFTPKQWVMYRQEHDDWKETARGSLPAHMKLSLQGTDGKIPLSDNPEPVLWFEPVGISSWYKLQVQNGQQSRTLRNSGDGRTLMETSS